MKDFHTPRIALLYIFTAAFAGRHSVLGTSVRARGLQGGEGWEGFKQLFSPGCIAIEAGKVYNDGAHFTFGFKYSLVFDEETHGEIVHTLEGRLQDYLQRILIHCEGSKEDDLSHSLAIDGVLVDLSSLAASDNCEMVQNYCLLDGLITIYSRQNNAKTSELQSTQGALTALKMISNDAAANSSNDYGIGSLGFSFLGGLYDSGLIGGSNYVSTMDNVAASEQYIFARLLPTRNELSALGKLIITVMVVCTILFVFAIKKKWSMRKMDFEEEEDYGEDDFEEEDFQEEEPKHDEEIGNDFDEKDSATY